METERADMRATPVPINWNSGLPIFASEAFLKAVGDEYGWIGGMDEYRKLRCILPYTIIRKGIFPMVRFRVETIPLEEGLSIDEEKLFLNSVTKYLRSIGADIIIPATTNTIFRTYPDGATVAPYGSYIIDLCQPEDVLWRNINRITRQNIKTALKSGVCIREDGIEHLDAAYRLIVETFQRSELHFMNCESLKRFVLGLGENGKIMVAEYQGILQSCVIYGFSNYCAYAIYGGNRADMVEGANKLLHWEAVRLFKNLGIQCYDFVGARIDPEKGSKEEAINSFKRRLGGKLRQGYMWKYSLRPVKSLAYSLAVRFLRGGDIVDLEHHKMKNLGSTAKDGSQICNDD
jgi:hypothetical protein